MNINLLKYLKVEKHRYLETLKRYVMSKKYNTFTKVKEARKMEELRRQEKPGSLTA